MEDIKVKVNEIIEKAKTDKKVLGIILIVLLVIVLMIFVMYNSVFGYDLDCSIQEDEEFYSIKAKFNEDGMSKFDMTMISVFEDEDIDSYIEYYDEYVEDLKEKGFDVSFKVKGSTVTINIAGNKKAVEEDDYSYYFSDDSLVDFRKDLLSENFICKK
ncbi:MAG: hypothetical protein R3Y13_02955 [bacterium]